MLKKINKIYKKNGTKKLITLGFGLLIKIFTLIVGIFVLRWVNTNLSQNDLKEFNIMNTISPILLSFGTFGLGFQLQRLYLHYLTDNSQESKDSFNELWSFGVIIQVITYLVGLVLLFIIYLNIGLTLPIYIFYILFTAQTLFAIDGNYRLITDANNETWKFTITELVNKLGTLFLLLFSTTLNIFDRNLTYYLISIMIFATVQLALDIKLQSKYVTFIFPKFQKMKAFIKENQFEILAFMLNVFLIAISATTDKLFINYFYPSGKELNGYTNSYKLLELTMQIEGILSPVLFFNLIKSNVYKVPWSKFIWKSPWFYIINSMAFVNFFGFIFFSNLLLPIIDQNKQYLEYSYAVIPFLASILLFNTLSNLLGQFIIYKKKFYIEVSGLGFYAFVSLILYYLLIPPYAHVGAGIASMISSISMVLFKYILFYFDYRKGIESF
jgi:O-antigen/teichoic acid export membrane protein